MFNKIRDFIFPGRVVMIRDGKETVVARRRRSGVMKINVESVEVDADWMRARFKKRTQPDGRILLKPLSGF